MREVLVYDDYEIHKLGAGGGTQYEEVTTEKATSIDVTDVAKPKGKLIPFGRTEQKQFQGYNLFNYAQVVNLAYGTQPGTGSGSYILASSLYRGYYIPVTAGEHYFVSRKNTTDFNRFRYCYTEIEPAVNVPIISGSQKTRDTYTSFDTVAPEGAGYLFLYLSNNDEDITTEAEVQITKSEELLPYEPYVGGTASPNPDYPQEIENVEGRSCRNLFKGDFSQFDNVGGEGSTYAYFALPDSTKKYTLTLIAKNDFTPTNYTYIGFTKNGGDASGNYSWVVAGHMSTITKGTVLSITSTSTLGFLSLFDKKEATLKLFMDNFEIMLEEGSSFTEYEPYFEGKRLEIKVANGNDSTAQGYEEQTIPFPLQEGQKLMEGDYLAEDGVHHVRGKMAVSDFTTWSKSANSNESTCLFTHDTVIRSGSLATNIAKKCNRFISQSVYNASVTEEGIFLQKNNGKLFIRIKNDRLTDTTIQAFIDWLSLNEVILEYELIEETIDPYTPAQQEAYNKLMNLMLYKGVNHIWTETDGLEPNLQLTYKRKKQSNVLQVSSIQPLNNLELNEE